MENYKFVKQIGEGSYGKVQLVRAPDGKNCVIKVHLRPDRNNSDFDAQSDIHDHRMARNSYLALHCDSICLTCSVSKIQVNGQVVDTRRMNAKEKKAAMNEVKARLASSRF